MKSIATLLVVFICVVTGLNAFAEDQAIVPTASPANARLYIIAPADGATVPATFTVTFGLENMGVAPAGVEKANTGHHHLLVDFEKLPPLDQPMGGDVKHFGGGQTQTELTLEPGTHTLQLILGDHRHIPHQPVVVSEKITVTVE